MFNFKKVNCKKVIINAVIVFCVFALTIVIIRIVNHKDKEAVMADLTQNEYVPSSRGLAIAGTSTPYSRILSTVCCIASSSLTENGWSAKSFNLLIGILITDSVGDVFFSLILIIHLFSVSRIINS